MFNDIFQRFLNFGTFSLDIATSKYTKFHHVLQLCTHIDKTGTFSKDVD